MNMQLEKIERPVKPVIVALLKFAWEQEEQMIAGLSDEQRVAKGTDGAWSARDYVVNIQLWKQLQTEKLATAQRGEVPPVWRDMELVHRINSEAFTRYQNWSFEEVEAEARRAYERLVAQVEQMSEEELNDPNHYAWQEGERLRGETLGNGLWHPCSQMTAFYLQSGDRQSALELQEARLAAERAFGLWEDGLSVSLYNQACFYATNGWPEKAIALLPEALRLKPTLLEWSKHDTDLDSLRGEPAFQALYDDTELLARVPASDLVSPEELSKSMNGEKPPLVIDVRGADEFAAGHLLGAMNIPVGTLERYLERLAGEQLVVTYCNMYHRGVSRGEQAATLLREHGIRARTLDGGYPAWKASTLPVE